MPCKAGSFAINTGTGAQAVTGLGFTPQVVIFQLAIPTADGSATAYRRGFGVGVSATQRASIAANSIDAAASSDCDRRQDIDLCIALADNAGNLVVGADLTTLDADGFTLNWTTADGTAHICTYLAIGGLAGAHLAQIQPPAVASSVGYTGPGFQPDILIAFTGGRTLSTSGGETNILQAIGMGVSSTSRQCVSVVSQTAQATMNTNRMHVTDKLISQQNAPGTVVTAADIDSLDATGYTLNWTTVTSRAYTFILALKGGRFALGQETQKTSAGTQATTGVGFTPQGLLLIGMNDATVGSVVDTNRLSIGFASGPTARNCIWSGDTDNVADSVTDTDLDTAAVLKHMTEGTPTTEAEADLSSFDADGFTLNWVTADGTARAFGWLAMADSTRAGHFMLLDVG